MARSYGSAATLLALKEASYGVKPPGNWEKFAFVSSDIGAEQNLLSSELLGQGREPRAPFRDVINDEGNIVVPVEARDFGRWLQLLPCWHRATRMHKPQAGPLSRCASWCRSHPAAPLTSWRAPWRPS